MLELRAVQSMRQEYTKIAADLTEHARAELPKKDFAVSAGKSNTGDRAYPIPDRQHASSALGFAKMHGDSADLASVRAKIKAKYPDMLKEKAAAFDAPAALKAALEEGGPALGAISGAGLAAGMGRSTLGGAALGYGAGSIPSLMLGGKNKQHKT